VATTWAATRLTLGRQSDLTQQLLEKFRIALEIAISKLSSSRNNRELVSHVIGQSKQLPDISAGNSMLAK